MKHKYHHTKSSPVNKSMTEIERQFVFAINTTNAPHTFSIKYWNWFWKWKLLTL